MEKITRRSSLITEQVLIPILLVSWQLNFSLFLHLIAPLLYNRSYTILILIKSQPKHCRYSSNTFWPAKKFSNELRSPKYKIRFLLHTIWQFWLKLLQVILSSGAKNVLREIQILMPLMKRILSVKVYDDQAYILLSIIDKIKR
jgi:hypothetical protein